MTTALNSFIGKGYTHLNGLYELKRPPLFPILIAFSYAVFGISPWSSFFIVKLFCILNPIAIYFLGKKYFNEKTGFAAALLVLTSYTLNTVSYRHLDAVWSFFAVLYLLTIYLAFEKESFFFFALSGLLLALSYLTKQSAIILFPLPFLFHIFVKDYRNFKMLIGGILFSFLFILIVLPWIYHVYTQTNDIMFSVLGKGGNRAANNTVGVNGLLNSIIVFSSGVISYYKGYSNSLSNNFLLAPVFVIAWLVNFYQSFKKKRSAIFLSLCFILLLPYISVVGQNNYRVGQMVLLLLLSYLVTARLVYLITWKTGMQIQRSYMSNCEKITSLLLFIFVGLLILIQTFCPYKKDKGNIHFLKRNAIVQKVFNNNTFRVTGEFGPIAKECGQWIKNNIPPGSKLMAAKQTPINFYSGGKDYRIFGFPIMNSKYLPEIEKKKIIFLSSFKAGDSPKNFLFALSEEDFFSSIKRNEIGYIVVQKRKNYLSIYLDKNNSFKKLKEFGNGAIKIYQLAEIKPMSNDSLIVTQRAISYLKILKNTNPNKLKWYVDCFFKPYFNFDYNDIYLISSLSKNQIVKKFFIVRKGKIY